MIQYYNMIGSTELIFLIIIGVIIIVAISAVRKRKNRDIIAQDEPQGNVSTVKEEQNANSLKILRERLAKGEITKEEYDKLKNEFE